MSNFEFFLPESKMLQYKSLKKLVKLLSCENITQQNIYKSDYDIEDYFIDDIVTNNMKKDNELIYNLRNVGLNDLHQSKESDSIHHLHSHSNYFNRHYSIGIGLGLSQHLLPYPHHFP
jgi:hypothetical protein